MPRNFNDLPKGLTVEVAAALDRVVDYSEGIEYLRRIFANDPVPDLLAKYGRKEDKEPVRANASA